MAGCGGIDARAPLAAHFLRCPVGGMVLPVAKVGNHMRGSRGASDLQRQFQAASSVARATSCSVTFAAIVTCFSDGAIGVGDQCRCRLEEWY